MELQQALRSIVMPNLQETLHVALLHWAAHAEGRRTKGQKLRRAVAAWSHSCVRTAFSAWLDYSTRQRELRAAALQVMLRWLHLKLHAGFQVRRCKMLCRVIAGLHTVRKVLSWGSQAWTGALCSLALTYVYTPPVGFVEDATRYNCWHCH